MTAAGPAATASCPAVASAVAHLEGAADNLHLVVLPDRHCTNLQAATRRQLTAPSRSCCLQCGSSAAAATGDACLVLLAQLCGQRRAHQLPPLIGGCGEVSLQIKDSSSQQQACKLVSIVESAVSRRLQRGTRMSCDEASSPVLHKPVYAAFAVSA